MSDFSLQPTPKAHWHALIAEAQETASYAFDDDIESYLVITLDHFTSTNNIVSSVIALDFLEALQASGQISEHNMRTVGDYCLLLSGLFPERALKKQVSLDYFIAIGRQAYYHIATNYPNSKLDSNLFYSLCEHFIGLMDVLHAIRIIESSKEN